MLPRGSIFAVNKKATVTMLYGSKSSAEETKKSPARGGAKNYGFFATVFKRSTITL